MRKNLLFLIMILVFTFSITCISFAAPEDTTVTDPNANPNPEIVTDIQYKSFEEETVPGGSSATSGTESVILPEEDIPLAPTGGVPAEIFYAAGALCVVTGIIISKRKIKTNK